MAAICRGLFAGISLFLQSLIDYENGNTGVVQPTGIVLNFRERTMLYSTPVVLFFYFQIDVSTKRFPGVGPIINYSDGWHLVSSICYDDGIHTEKRAPSS